MMKTMPTHWPVASVPPAVSGAWRKHRRLSRLHHDLLPIEEHAKAATADGGFFAELIVGMQRRATHARLQATINLKDLTALAIRHASQPEFFPAVGAREHDISRGRQGGHQRGPGLG